MHHINQLCEIKLHTNKVHITSIFPRELRVGEGVKRVGGLCFFQNPVATFHRKHNMIFVLHEQHFNSGKTAKKKKNEMVGLSTNGPIKIINCHFIMSHHTLYA